MKILALLSILLLSNIALAAPGRTTYQAKIIKPDGHPLESTAVNFRFTIMDPASSCILYVEDYAAVNMSGGGGLISFSLGGGIRSFPVSGTSSTFSNVFDNSAAFLNCQPTGTYNPTPSDARKIVMQFQDSNGWQTLPAMSINAVPYAMYATKSDNSVLLNGKADTAFVERSTLPSCVGGQALYFNGATFSCVAASGGVGGGITSVSTSGTVLSTGGTASAPVISITAASMSSDGYLTSLDYADFKSRLTASSTQIINTLGFAPVSGAQVTQQIASSTLTGDVTGSISANTVSNVGGKTASQVSTSVDSILTASASNVVSTIVKRDSSGNFTANDITGNSVRINYADIYKPSTNFSIRLQAPTSLSANYTLSLPSTSGTAGQVLSTDGSGNLNWVSAAGGSLVSVSATTPLSSTGGATPTISITQATSSTNGYLSNTDFNTFNNKQNQSAELDALAATTALGILQRTSGASYSALALSAPLQITGSNININLSSDLAISGTALALSATGIVSGSYSKIIVDTKGRVTSGTQLSSSDVAAALGYTPASSAAVTTQISNALSSQNLSGDVSGTLSATVVSSVGSKTASQISTSVDDTQAASASNGVNTIVKRDASGATSLSGLSIGTSSSTTYPVEIHSAGTNNTGNGLYPLAIKSDGGDATATGFTIWNPSSPASSFFTFAFSGNSMAGSRLGISNLSNGVLMFNNAAPANSAAFIALGTTNAAPVYFSTNNIVRQSIDMNGNIGIGIGLASATALVHLKAGTATNAPLKFTSGTLLTSPQSGTMEYDGSNLYYTDSTNTRRTLASNSGGQTNSGNNTYTGINTFSGVVNVSNNTASTNSTTGAFVVSGGIGIGGVINVAGNANVSGALTTTGLITSVNAVSAPFIYAGAGSATLPSHTFSTDVNTGMWQPTSGAVALSTAGLERVRVTSGGNVGIGTTTPSFTLSVSGGAHGALSYISGTDSSAFNPSVPNASLDIENTSTTLNSYSGIHFKSNSADSAIVNTRLGSNLSRLDFYVDNNPIPATPSLSMLNGGNVGIGTATPNAQLHVATDLQIGVSNSIIGSRIYSTGNSITHTYGYNDGTANANHGRFVLSGNMNSQGFDSLTDSGGLVLRNDSGTWGALSQSSGDLRFLVGGTSSATAQTYNTYSASMAMVVKASGNVGIGTNSPSVALEVVVSAFNGGAKIKAASGIGDMGLYLDNTANSGSNWWIDSTGAGSGAGPGVLAFRADGAAGTLKLNALGTLTVSNVIQVNGVANSYFIGNVGIGTTVPTAKLQLASGTTTTASLKITSGALLSSPADGAIEYDGSNLYYTDSTNTRRTLASNSGGQTNSGNNTYTGVNTFSGVVNVSNNTASTNSTTGAFVVSGGVGIGGAINVAGNANVSGALTTTGLITSVNAVSAPFIYAGAGSATLPSHTFSTDVNTGMWQPTSGAVALSTAGLERVRVASGGNVGIGTTTPTAPLDVQAILSGTAGSNLGIIVRRNSSQYININEFDGSAHSFDAISASGSPKQLRISNFTNGGAPVSGSSDISFNIGQFGGAAIIPMTLQAVTGYVGIGTTTPGYKLDVSGTINIASGSALAFGGSTICTSSGCNSPSDIRLKENIKPLDLSLEKILSLNGVQYDWKNKAKYGDKHQVGFIAQNLEQVYPEIVYTDKLTGIKSVSYGNLVAPIIEAIKTLYQRIVGVEDHNLAQDRRIASIVESKADKEEIELLKARDLAKSKEIETVRAENIEKSKQIDALKAYLCGKDPNASICK